MRKRPIKMQIWLNDIEYKKLIDDSKKENTTMSDHIRKLILGAKLKEKPGIEFYNVMNEMSRIGNNLNQIAKKANSLDFINTKEYQENADELKNLITEIKEKYL